MFLESQADKVFRLNQKVQQRKIQIDNQKKFIESIFDGKYKSMQNEYPNWKLKDN